MSASSKLYINNKKEGKLGDQVLLNSNILYYSDSPLGALLKREVIANKNILSWGFELATRWQEYEKNIWLPDLTE